MEKEPWIGAETLEWFYRWCRDHGIPGDNRKLQSGIISGVFYPAAIAVPDLLREGRYQFFYFSGAAETMGRRERDRMEGRQWQSRESVTPALA